MSALVRELLKQIEWAGLPAPELEYKFHPKRRWKFDMVWKNIMLACEIEGGVWIRGRHVQGSGYTRDCEKYDEGILAGWKIIRVTSDMIRKGKALDFVERALKGG